MDELQLGSPTSFKFIDDAPVNSNFKSMILLPPLIPMSLDQARHFTHLFQGQKFVFLAYHSDTRKVAPSLNSFLGCLGTRIISFKSKGDMMDDEMITNSEFDRNQTRVFCKYEVLASMISSEPAMNMVGCSISLNVEWNGFQKFKDKPINPTNVVLDVFYVPGNIDPDSHESSADLRVQLEKLQCWNRNRGTTVDIEGTKNDEKAKSFLDGIFCLIHRY